MFSSSPIPYFPFSWLIVTGNHSDILVNSQIYCPTLSIAAYPPRSHLIGHSADSSAACWCHPQFAQWRDPAMGLPDVYPAGEVRRARRSRARHLLPHAAAALRLRRRRLQDQGGEPRLLPHDREITGYSRTFNAYLETRTLITVRRVQCAPNHK